MARFRTTPEDFVVDELPLFEASGEGPHTYLWIEKRLRNTDDVARELAQLAGVAGREVGYAGRKDRVAVTRQYFSVPGLDPERACALELRDARVLEARRHRHRLRTGQLAGNRFELVLREVSAAEAEAARTTLDHLCRRGLPNRFGRQRFGNRGGNVARGLELLRADRLRGDRRRARLMVSALQSEVFNRVLERRAGEIDRLREGDVAVVHASGGLFRVEDVAREAPRAEGFEVSATGPIFGTKMKRPGGEPARLEAEVMAELGLEDPSRLRLPRGLRLFGSRRSLRVEPRGASLEKLDGDWRLRFELPAGSYATVLLEELFPTGLEEGAAVISP